MASFKQERHVELVPGANELFVITSELVSAAIPAELPHLNVFVISVRDALDPTQDKLARVANIADLTTVPIGRDPGVAAPGPNGIEFLSQAATSSYDTLETARAAATAFQDRVNALIEHWILFRTTFNAPDPTPALYTFPRVDATQKEALITAYANAKQNAYQTQLLKTEADSALVRAQADYTYKASRLDATASLLTQATGTQTNLAIIIADFATLLLSGQTFWSANSGVTGALAFVTQLNTMVSEKAGHPGMALLESSLVIAITGYNNARVTDAANANIALTAAQSDQTTKTQLLVAANVTTATALAAVLAVCPDFVPASIPYVPG